MWCVGAGNQALVDSKGRQGGLLFALLLQCSPVLKRFRSACANRLDLSTHFVLLESRLMNVRSIVLVAISATLIGCGVRDEELSGAEPGTGAGSFDLGGGTVQGFEGNDEVSLSFDGTAWSGYWDEQGSIRVARVSLGEMYYHVELFTDESQRQGTAGRNCFARAGNFWLTPAGAGMRRPHQVDADSNYEEWIVQDDELESFFFGAEGTVAATDYDVFDRTFEGLAINDLQICSED